jgi:hypothetical protein
LAKQTLKERLDGLTMHIYALGAHAGVMGQIVDALNGIPSHLRVQKDETTQVMRALLEADQTRLKAPAEPVAVEPQEPSVLDDADVELLRSVREHFKTRGKPEDIARARQIDKIVSKVRDAVPAPDPKAKATTPVDALVNSFSEALRAKLHAAEAKYQWGDGWLLTDWESDFQGQFSDHVAKGDPIDVAAYAAFAWYHGWSTAPATPQTNVLPRGGIKPMPLPLAAEVETLPRKNCRCNACHNARYADSAFERLTIFRGLVVCQNCGNKRCPKVGDHRFQCSGSNDVGQVGILEESLKPPAAEIKPKGCHWIYRQLDTPTETVRTCMTCQTSYRPYWESAPRCRKAACVGGFKGWSSARS